MGRSRLPISKPKTLRRKNIMKKKGKTSQAKQIYALSRQVNKLARVSTTRFSLSWQKQNQTINVVSPSADDYAYILPIPTNCCDPFNALSTNVDRRWTDNRYAANGIQYGKIPVFQVADEVKTAKRIKHTGSKLRWQLTSTEPSFNRVTVALIRPKKAFADQLVTDRKLITGQTPGSEGFLQSTVDYVVHNGAADNTGAMSQTIFAPVFDKTKWDIIYRREVGFGHPNAQGISANTSANNTSPLNNALIATGTIYVPPAKNMIRNVSLRVDGTVNVDPPNAIEACILDQSNEDRCYLVVLQNGSRVDGEYLSLATVCQDYYTAFT